MKRYSKEEIIAMFPLEVEVTQEMIDKGYENIFDTRACIGFQALKSVLPEDMENDITWGCINGSIWEETHEEFLHRIVNGGINNERVRLSSKIDMMEIKKPIKVTFTVK